MSETPPSWLRSGRGIPPRKRWSFTVDAPLVELKWSRETGEALAADAAGGLYRIDQNGRLAALTRGFQQLRGLAFSDVGNRGAAVIAEKRLCCFDRHLKVDWSLEMPEPVTAIGMDPQGNYIGVALSNGRNVVYDVERKLVCRFETQRPLRFLKFLVTEPAIIGAAEFDLLCRIDFTGREVWSERLLCNIGDVSATGDGGIVFAAVFNQGIRMFDAEGAASGSYLIEGTAHRLAVSYDAGRLLVTTLEGHLYWLDDEGELVWAAGLPEDIQRVCCNPLGTGILCGFQSGRLTSLYWE